MFKLQKPYNYLLIGAIAFLVLLYFLTQNLPFFWDAHSKSIRATWFLENNFSQWVIPTELSAGHPPLWEVLLALTWKFTERTLEYSRLLLLVFNIGVFWQLTRFLRDHKMSAVPYLALIIVFLEPTLLAQTTIINNDMMLLFFTLLGLNSIYRNDKILYSIALTGVLFSNVRGISIFASLFLIEFLFYWFKLKKNKQEFLWISYFIPVFIFGAFLMYHYQILGWILKKPHHEHREIADFMKILKNIAAIAKSILESGRIFLFGLLGILVFRYLKKQNWANISHENKRLIISFSIFFLVSTVLFTFMTNPVSPRYYMICFLIATLLCLNLIFELIPKVKWQKGSVIFLAVAFLTGHLWIWPPTISQGWDTSLAYLNYFPLRDKMENYLVENSIPKSETGTNLNLNNPEYIDLKQPADTLYPELDTSSQRYIILSNIENKTSDQDINLLMNHWKLIQSYKQLGVFVNLYENPNYLEK